MAVFVGYGDESGKQDDPWSSSSAYALLVGPDECWDDFNRAWNAALKSAGIEYFHRKDFGKPNGPYAHLDEAAEKQLSIALVEALRGIGLKAYASAVRHSALEQFNSQTGLRLDAYALSLWTCLCYLRSAHNQSQMTLYLDHVENKQRKLALMQDYIETDLTIPELRDWLDSVRINNAPKPKPENRLAKAPGYQAADFVAWEARKYVHITPEEERQRKALDGFVRPMDWPPMRRRESLHELDLACGIQGTLWDVEVLKHENEVRSGVWKPKD